MRLYRKHVVPVRLLSGTALSLLLMVATVGPRSTTRGLAQKRPSLSGQTSNSRERVSTEASEMVEVASETVCNERVRDPKGSVPIDDMQSRPSLPVDTPEAVAGAPSGERLLPLGQRPLVCSLRA